jgi:hypothetical protein
MDAKPKTDELSTETKPPVNPAKPTLGLEPASPSLRVKIRAVTPAHDRLREATNYLIAGSG